MDHRRSWTVGFDADDTLWHNERFFRLTHARLADLLRPHTDLVDLSAHLDIVERRNLGRYGFGIKGFTLSMIETAVEVTEGRVPGTVVAEILAAGHDMLAHPVELLPGAREAVEDAAARAEVVLITKGDLLDQERKLAASGLGELFDRVEIVSDKTPATYARAFAAAEHCVMVGNSVRSDILPALEAGAWAVHVPHDLTWSYEHGEAPEGHSAFRQIADLHALPGLLTAIGVPPAR